MPSEDTKSQRPAGRQDPSTSKSRKHFSTIRQLFLEQKAPVVAESGRTSGRDPFLVGFGVSFFGVAIVILAITAFSHMDSIAERLIPKSREPAVEVTEPGQEQFELSVAEDRAELPERTEIEQSTVSLESDRFNEAQPSEDAAESTYEEVEDFADDFEDGLALPDEAEERVQEEIALAPPVSQPEPEPEIVQRTEPQLIRLPRPRYPMAARRQALKAKVRVKVLIGVDGNVKEVKLAGRPVGTGFDEAALTAAKDTRWMPATENEEFIETWGDLVVEFEP